MTASHTVDIHVTVVALNGHVTTVKLILWQLPQISERPNLKRVSGWRKLDLGGSVLNGGITMCVEINQFTQNVRQHNLFILD